MVKGSQGRKDRSRVKIGFVMSLFAVALVGLWVRTGWVQIHEGSDLLAQASRQSRAAECEYGARGRIFDRNGQMLATSVEAKSVYARPFEVANVDVAADSLSRTLGIARSTVYKRLKSRKKFVWIKRQVTDREALAVSEANLPGVRLVSEFSRIYPNGHLAGPGGWRASSASTRTGSSRARPSSWSSATARASAPTPTPRAARWTSTAWTCA